MSNTPSAEEMVAAGRRAVEANDAGAANEIANALEQHYPEYVKKLGPDARLTQDVVESATGLPGQLKESAKRYGDPKTYSSELIPGNPDTRNPVSLAANVLEPALEAVGAIGNLGWDAWWASFGRAFPEGSKDDVEEMFASAGNSLYSVAEPLIEKYPMAAAAFKDIMTVSEVGLPAGAGTRRAISTAAPGLQRKAVANRTVATTDKLETNRRGLADLVAVEDPKGEIPQVKETGIFRKGVREPTRREQDMIGTLETFESVDPSRSFWYNTAAINSEVNNLKQQTEAALRRNKKKKIPKKAITDEITNFYENMSEETGFFMLSADAVKAAQGQIQEIVRMLDSTPGDSLTPMQALEMRRNFDRVFETTGGNPEAPMLNAKLFTSRRLRGVLNDNIKQVVKDENVHDLLDRQHEGLNALRIVNKKRIAQENTLFGRIKRSLQDINIPTTPIALYTLGSVGVAGATALAAPLGVTAGAGMAGYTVYRMASSKAKNRMLAEVQAALAKAAREAPERADEIASARIAIAEIMKYNAQNPNEEVDPESLE